MSRHLKCSLSSRSALCQGSVDSVGGQVEQGWRIIRLTKHRIMNIRFPQNNQIIVFVSTEIEIRFKDFNSFCGREGLKTTFLPPSLDVLNIEIISRFFHSATFLVSGFSSTLSISHRLAGVWPQEARYHGAQSRPIRAQYSGHVIRLIQSEASNAGALT